MLFSYSDYSFSWWIWALAKCLLPSGLPMTVSLLLLSDNSMCEAEWCRHVLFNPFFHLLCGLEWIFPEQYHCRNSVILAFVPVSPDKFLNHESTGQLPLGCYKSWVPGGQKAKNRRENRRSVQRWSDRTSSWKVGGCVWVTSGLEARKWANQVLQVLWMICCYFHHYLEVILGSLAQQPLGPWEWWAFSAHFLLDASSWPS